MIMPWRVNTLTEFKTSPVNSGRSGAASDLFDKPCSEEGAPSSGELEGECASSQVGLEPGMDLFDGRSISSEFSFLHGAASNRGVSQAAFLGATQVPRGPVLSDD